MPSSRLFDTLAAVLLGLSVLSGMLCIWLFRNPRSALNPFPPSPPLAMAAVAPASPPPASAPAVVNLYPTLPAPWTPTLTPPPTFTRTPRPTATPTPTSTPRPTATPTPTLAAEVRLTVSGHKQALSLSCEARSAADWAGYFGLTIDEQEFLGRLPVSDNPEAGFVGDVKGEWGNLPPNGYGVYAGPVAELLRAYGAPAQAAQGLTWEDLKREIAAGRPVIVWVVGHLWEGKAETYTSQAGQAVTVARYEHTMLVVGYTSTRVVVLDGEKSYTRTLEAFERSWSVLGNMAILWRP